MALRALAPPCTSTVSAVRLAAPLYFDQLVKVSPVPASRFPFKIKSEVGAVDRSYSATSSI
ncbi:hypothetical protein D3C85_1434200 [compost metagenome]